eukprot:gene13915-29599_t
MATSKFGHLEGVFPEQAILFLLGDRSGVSALPPSLLQWIGLNDLLGDHLDSTEPPFILIPAEAPDYGQPLDAAFFKTTRWVVGSLIRRPTARNGGGMVVKCCGQYPEENDGGNGQPTLPTNTLLYMEPPPLSVFYPKPMLLDSLIDRFRPEGNPVKKARVGELSQVDVVPKEYHAYHDLDNRPRVTSSKAEGVQRIKLVQTLLRVLPSATKFRDALIPDLVFKVSEYVGAIRDRECRGVTLTGNYAYIANMPVSSSETTMEKAILGDWKYRNWSHLSVMSFAPQSVQSANKVYWKQNETSHLACKALADGLEGLSRFWSMFWNVEFEGCFHKLIAILGNRQLTHIAHSHNLFIRARVEALVSDFNTDIRSRADSIEFPQCPMTSAVECHALLDQYILAFFVDLKEKYVVVWETAPHLRFYSSEGEYAMITKENVPGVASPSVSSGSGKSTSANRSSYGPSPNATAKKICGWHVADLLGHVINNKRVSCSRQQGCHMSHPTLKEMRRSEAKLAAQLLPPSVRDQIVSKFILPSQSLVESGRRLSTRSSVGHIPDFYCEQRLSSGISLGDWTQRQQRPLTAVALEDITDSRGSRHILVAVSSHLGAGNGAIPLVPLTTQGTWIGSYTGAKGPFIDLGDYQLECDGIQINAWVDGKATCLCAYINDPLDDLQENVRLIRHGDSGDANIRLVTTRDVSFPDEFGMAYGEEYWLSRALLLEYEVYRRAKLRYCVPSTLARWAAAEDIRTWRSGILAQIDTSMVPSVDDKSAVLLEEGEIVESLEVERMEATRKVSVNEATVHEAVDYNSLKKTIDDGSSCKLDKYSTISTEVEESSKRLPVYMAEVIGIATRMYPGLLDLRKSGAIEAAVREAVDYNSLEKTIEDAVEWGGNYVIPAEYFSEDSALFEKHDGCLASMATERLLEL